MKLLVIGTLAFDTVETPFAKRERVLGGSATYFSHAASYFSPVELVGVVGNDFPDQAIADFKARQISTEGVEVVDGKSMFWSGRYEQDWNIRHTLDTQLNVFADFDPKIPAGACDAELVFLANAEPKVQMKALDQCSAPKLVVADTMNLWIDIALDDLKALVKRVDGLVLNDEEARMLTGESNLFAAGRKVLEMGPKFIVLKKGEHGAFLLGAGMRFALPAYPVENVVDPTGAGDAFAGGFMGHIARSGKTDAATLRKAMLYGTVTASYCVEGFSTESLASRSDSDIEARFAELSAFVTP